MFLLIPFLVRPAIRLIKHHRLRRAGSRVAHGPGGHASSGVAALEHK